MSDMDALPPLDLPHVPSIVIKMMLQGMSLKDRFTCALVCKAWAAEATAATSSIILSHEMYNVSCLQRWLEKHGDQVEVLQLRDCRYLAVLTALPCPKLRDLLLRGDAEFRIDNSMWSDIAAATKLTSVSLESLDTASQQADVVSALTALPDLEQLTWSGVKCGRQWELSDSMLLHALTKLTALQLRSVTAAALEHLGLLTRLQDLSLSATADWAAAGCPGLQELKALTRLKLVETLSYIPPGFNQLTALKELDVTCATPTALSMLSALTGLARVRVQDLQGLTRESPTLQLPGLQCLQVEHGWNGTMPVSYLVGCTQLQVLELANINLTPGNLVASSMLQHLQLQRCTFSAADEAADLASWQPVFPGPGQLPHLTSLKISCLEPIRLQRLRHADMECVVACCSSLQVLHLGPLPDYAISPLTRLSGLSSLTLWNATDQQCSSLAQLTGLRELRLQGACNMFAAGLRQLAALEQLTSLVLICSGWKNDVLREQMSDKLTRPSWDWFLGMAIHTDYWMYERYALINKVSVYVGGGRGVVSHKHWHPDCRCCVEREGPRQFAGELHQHHTSLPLYRA